MSMQLYRVDTRGPSVFWKGKDFRPVYLVGANEKGKTQYLRTTPVGIFLNSSHNPKRGKWEAYVSVLVKTNYLARDIPEWTWIGTFPTRKQAIDQIVSELYKHKGGLMVMKPFIYEPAAIKRIIEQFEETGTSTHSANGSTLPYIIEYCERSNIPYRLNSFPGKGYVVEKLVSSNINSTLFEGNALLTIEQRAYQLYCAENVAEHELAVPWNMIDPPTQDKYVGMIIQPEPPEVKEYTGQYIVAAR